jgi:hypothetical protein
MRTKKQQKAIQKNDNFKQLQLFDKLYNVSLIDNNENNKTICKYQKSFSNEADARNFFEANKINFNEGFLYFIEIFNGVARAKILDSFKK